MNSLIASSRYQVVVGLGPTGLSVARHLASIGAQFQVFDTRPEPPELGALEQELPEVRVYLGEVPDGVLAGAEELIVSPGLAPDHPVLAPAIAAGVPVRGDVDLFMRARSAPVVAITGTNAKSTVTSLVGEMARCAGVRVAVGGNLGTPALDLLAHDVELYVLELSSFQLERSEDPGVDVATVLNLSPDHLDRHGTMPRYHQAKHRIYSSCGHAVVHSDDPLTIPPMAEGRPVTAWRLREPELGSFGLRREEDGEWLCHGFERWLPVSGLRLQGRHNLANALAGLALGHAAGLPREAMLEALGRFTGLPHRCELVLERDGIAWINDSKGTNVGATEAALRGVGEQRRVVLLAGGESKGADFRRLAPLARRHLRAAVLFGESASELEAVFSGACSVERAVDLGEAVRIAAERAETGDAVLLSPACASFDMFRDYRDRGEQFAAAVRALAGETAA